MTHLVYIPFTGVGKHQYKGDEWFAERIEIFKNYTLKSLENQTNTDFALWLSFRPEDLENPLKNDLEIFLTQKNIPYIATYNGLIYHDDRNEENNKTLKYRYARSIEQIRTDNEWVYITRIDSDDMLHEEAVSLIQKQEPFEGALVLQNGYILNRDTREVAEWNPITCPPFFTVMMRRETFLDPDRYLALWGEWKSHEDTARMKHKTLWRENDRRDRLYCVTVGNPKAHISTTWEHEFKGKPVNVNLKHFGVEA